MLGRIVLAVVVAVIITLACVLVGGILITVNISLAGTVGSFLKTYSGVLGILGGLWFYFARGV